MAPQSSLSARAALLVLAMAAAGLQTAAARRGLAQAATAAAGDGASAPAGAPASEAASPAVEASDGQQSIYGSPQVDYCIELTNKAGQACTVESDTCEWLKRPGSCAVQLPPQSYRVLLADDLMLASSECAGSSGGRGRHASGRRQGPCSWVPPQLPPPPNTRC